MGVPNAGLIGIFAVLGRGVAMRSPELAAGVAVEGTFEACSVGLVFGAARDDLELEVVAESVILVLSTLLFFDAELDCMLVELALFAGRPVSFEVLVFSVGGFVVDFSTSSFFLSDLLDLEELPDFLVDSALDLPLLVEGLVLALSFLVPFDRFLRSFRVLLFLSAAF